MSISEPGNPYFRGDESIEMFKEFKGSHLTTAGLWRQFPVTTTSPHEPWCFHFEWGACNCGPRDGEVFMSTQTVELPR